MLKQVAHPVLPDFTRAKPETEIAPCVRRTRTQMDKPEAPNAVSTYSIIFNYACKSFNIFQ